MVRENTSTGMSYETKTIIVILTLLFITPVGLILMWIWMKWPTWLKVLITILPFLFAFLITSFVIWLLAVIFSNKDIQKQMHEQMQQNVTMQISQTTPTVISPLGRSRIFKTTIPMQ